MPPARAAPPGPAARKRGGQKIAGQGEACGDVGGGRHLRRSSEEGRQHQELVGPRRARGPRGGPTGLGRNIAQVGADPGHGTGVEVEAEAEVGQNAEFEPHQQRRRQHRLGQLADHPFGGGMEVGVRIALRQQPQQSSNVLQAERRRWRRDQCRGALHLRFHRVGAEMLVEPGPPRRLHGVAGLEHRSEPSRAAAAHHAEMAAMGQRHQFQDDAGFPVGAGADDEADVGPIHGVSYPG